MATRCERCDAETTLADASVYSKAPEHGRWEIVCTPCSHGAYWVPVTELLAGGGMTLDWLGRIAGKPWNDGGSFFQCMHRLRKIAFGRMK